MKPNQSKIGFFRFIWGDPISLNTCIIMMGVWLPVLLLLWKPKWPWKHGQVIIASEALPLLVPAGMIATVLAVIVCSYRYRWIARTLLNGRPVTGTITEVKYRGRWDSFFSAPIKVRFQYRVDNVDYNRKQGLEEENVPKDLSLEEGVEVSLLVDPQNPGRALIRGSQG